MCLLVTIRAHFKGLNGQSFNSERSLQAETYIQGMTWEDRLPRETWQKDANINAVQVMELNGSLKKSSQNVTSTADTDSVCQLIG